MASQSVTKCPKCGGQMIDGACTKCKYSKETALTKQEAKDHTHAG